MPTKTFRRKGGKENKKKKKLGRRAGVWTPTLALFFFPCNVYLETFYGKKGTRLREARGSTSNVEEKSLLGLCARNIIGPVRW